MKINKNIETIENNFSSNYPLDFYISVYLSYKLFRGAFLMYRH